MAERLDILIIPTGDTDGALAGSLSQFFQTHRLVTLRNISFYKEERNGTYRYRIVISYESGGGGNYGAVEFSDTIGGTSADFQLQDHFLNNPQHDLIKVFIASRYQKRFTTQKRLLAIYQIRAEAYRTQDLVHYAGVAAEDIAAGATENVKQLSAVSIDPDQLLARNASGTTWPSQQDGVVVTDLSGERAGVMCCGSSGSDDVEALPADPDDAVCADAGPDTITGDPPETPAQAACLRYDHVCQCIDDVDTWVLSNIECVNNALCVPFSQECTHTTAHWEMQNACTPGQALPAIAGDPPCEPICCTVAPPEPRCCLQAQFDCLCIESASGDDISVWDLTSIACVANGACADVYKVEYLDTDADNRIDRCTFEAMDWCACGTVDEAVMLGLLPGDSFQQNASPPPSVIPKIEPECCDEDCCLVMRYVCVDYYGTSVWVFVGAVCVDNDYCSSGTTRTCFSNLAYQLTSRDACSCDDKGSVSQSTAESTFPNEPPASCPPICSPITLGKQCLYFWEATYDCDSAVWGDPVLVDTFCLRGATATNWALKAGETCVYERRTVENNC